MKKNLLVVSCLAIMSVALVYGQAAAPQGKAGAPAAQVKAQAAPPAPKGARISYGPRRVPGARLTSIHDSQFSISR